MRKSDFCICEIKLYMLARLLVGTIAAVHILIADKIDHLANVHSLFTSVFCSHTNIKLSLMFPSLDRLIE